MRPAELPFPRNPAYGSGSCRRLIRITGHPGAVDAHLSDNFHAFRCRIEYDGRTVVKVEGTAIRIPTTGCPQSVTILRELEGRPIDADGQTLYGGGQALRHCTHLYDLAVIAIRHANLPQRSVVYDALVPDETDGPVSISIRRDDRVVHRWLVREGKILEPSALLGRTLDKGFAAWAKAAFRQSDDLEAAVILARTWLIAIGRRYLMEGAGGRPIIDNDAMQGRCFAYRLPERVHATYTDGLARSPSDLEV